MLPTNDYAFGKNAHTNSAILMRILRDGLTQRGFCDGNASKRIAIACSGGADSVALLWTLYKLQQRESSMMNFSVEVVHFNHGLRKDGTAEGDERFVYALARDMGYFFRKWDLSLESGNTHDEAHWKRKELLESISVDLILQGHHLDDQVEHLFMRMISGRKLEIIPEENGRIWRPFLGVEKRWLHQFLDYQGHPWREDPSNRENEYSRNKIRNLVFPLLQELFPDWNIKKGILRLGHEN